MEKRYVALRSIAIINKVLGIIFGVITILSVLGICLASFMGGAAMGSFGDEFGMGGMMGSLVGGILLSIGTILWGGLLSLTMYASGEILMLLIAMEENTRATAMMIQKGMNP